MSDLDENDREHEDQDHQDPAQEPAQDPDEGGDDADVPGVTADPEDGDKALAVDTNERLEQKDKHLDDVPEDQLEKEREERLDPDNRPDNVEVDNSDREFDPETGHFKDDEDDLPDQGPFETEAAEG